MTDDELTPDALKERKRCEQIASSVQIAARNWLKAGCWPDRDRIAWESRERAASDILASIHMGVECKGAASDSGE